MRVSAIILSFNSAPYLEKCVPALVRAFEASDEPNEMWIVENGSTDGSVALLEQYERDHPGLVNGIYCPHNTGTTVSRNQGLRRATGRYILIIDSDVEVPVGTIEPLIERLDADPGLGILAPRLMYPSGNLQISTDVFPTVTRKLQRFWALKAMERAAETDDEGMQERLVDYAISAFWLFRRELLDRVGRFDERIFYSPEDVDYCLRVWQAGYKISYVPSVHAIHDAQEISRGFKQKLFTWSHAKGLLYLFRKHGYALNHNWLYKRLNRLGEDAL